MLTNKLSYFDEYIDPECVPLILALNNLPGIKTIESCCGHLKDPFMIFFKCNNFISLAIIARAFDDRYSDAKWRLEVETADTEDYPYKTFDIVLISKKPFKTWEEMIKSINSAVSNLNYWSSDKFKDHFKGLNTEHECDNCYNENCDEIKCEETEEIC